MLKKGKLHFKNSLLNLDHAIKIVKAVTQESSRLCQDVAMLRQWQLLNSYKTSFGLFFLCNWFHDDAFHL
jgi:hypothetical protein